MNLTPLIDPIDRFGYSIDSERLMGDPEVLQSLFISHTKPHYKGFQNPALLHSEIPH